MVVEVSDGHAEFEGAAGAMDELRERMVRELEMDLSYALRAVQGEQRWGWARSGTSDLSAKESKR